jgi:hypothetical protein
MPNEDGMFTQAELEKAVRARTAEMKTQRDTARDEAATFKKQHAEAVKASDGFKVRAERADEYEAQVATVRGEFDAYKTRSGRQDVLRDALGGKYSKGAALGLMGEYGETEGAGEFPEWVAAQVAGRSGLIGALLGPAEVPTNGAGTPAPAPAPTAPSVNGGTGGAPPPAAPEFGRGQIASMPAADWAAYKAQLGMPVKT